MFVVVICLLLEKLDSVPYIIWLDATDQSFVIIRMVGHYVWPRLDLVCVAHHAAKEEWLDQIIIFRLNCSFSLLTFPKLRFWPLRKKLQNNPLSFATVAVLAPQGKKIKIKNTWHPLRVPRQRRPSQYQSWGPKLLQLQNLGGCFVVFFP